MTNQALVVRSFLIAKFGSNFSGKIALWSKQRPNKAEFYGHEQINELVQSIISHASDEDLYIGVGTRHEGLSTDGQGGNSDVVAMSGLFADIDSATDKDSNKKYPASKAEARIILESFPLKPTLIVDTGNGLHVHWIFEKSFVINNEEERKKIARISKAFERMLQAHFATRGSVIDSVGDLARICRIPGTFNHKGGTKKLVEIIYQNREAVHSIGNVEEFVKSKLDSAKETENTKTPLLVDHDRLVKECSWYRTHIIEGASTCDEPNWYAGASITSQFKGGAQYFHEYSRIHPDYDPDETERKFQHAKDDAGPRTCTAIRYDLGNEEYCGSCPHWGKITSPVQLGQEESGSLTKVEFIEAILKEVELFHDSGSTPYVTIKHSGAHLTYRIKSRAFKLWINGKYYKLTQKSLATNSLTEIVNILSAVALFEGERKSVFVRVAPYEDGIVIDLGDEKGRVAVVRPSGWVIEAISPVKFERPMGMAELPVPSANGNIKLFQEILGLSEAEWLPVLCFLICCLHPTGPYTILIIEAEQGAGKSVLTWAIKYVIDPSKVSKARLSNKLDDLLVMARENWLLCFDNVSSLAQETSDDLSSILTGSGKIVRKLYTNDDAHIANYCRPMSLNGISGLHLSPDLVDRAISLRLTRKADKPRKTEKELRAEFERARPGILGNLLDIIVVALQRWDEVSMPPDMRMADCAEWLAAGEPATGLRQGTLVDSVILSQGASYVEAVETDALAQLLISLVRQNEFSGTMGDLFARLHLAESRIPYMPKTPSQLSKTLRRQKPAYEYAGLMIDIPARISTGQRIRIWLRDNNPSATREF